MRFAKMQQAAAVVLAPLVMVVGMGAAGNHPALAGNPAPVGQAPPEAKSGPVGCRNLLDIVSRQGGQVIAIGTPVGPDEHGPEIITVSMGGQKRKYRGLKEGDRIEEGQVVGHVDSSLAKEDLAIAGAKLAAVMADKGATEKTRDEAQQRFLAAQKLFEKKRISEEDYRAVRLTRDRYTWEAKSKEAAVVVARLEQRRLEVLVGMYDLRSLVGGTITQVYKYPGEGVQALEPVLQVRVAGK